MPAPAPADRVEHAPGPGVLLLAQVGPGDRVIGMCHAPLGHAVPEFAALADEEGVVAGTPRALVE
eukprot:4665068-Alexandrium_andersonii.AAC.1